MNWEDRICENLVEAKLEGTSRGPKKGQVSRTYRRGKSKTSKKRTTVSVSPISGRLRRKEWTSTAKDSSGWKTQDDAPTVPPMGKPGSPAREKYNQYKRDAGIR